MTGVAPYGSLMRVNGPGREALRLAVERHRTRRGWSRERMAERGGPSAGTVKNVERTSHDVREATLIAIDRVFSWPEDTARAILIDKVKAPALPDRQPAIPAGMPRRLVAELEGRDVVDYRAFELPGIEGTRVIITLATTGDEVDLNAIRDALRQIDELERRFRQPE